MYRRLSRAVLAALFTLVLCLSTPAAFAAQRNVGNEPDFGTRIVRVLKNIARHIGLMPSSESDAISIPKP